MTGQKKNLCEGFSGLKSYTDSDKAADLGFAIEDVIVKTLKKGLKEKEDSGYNTGGPVNVALIILTHPLFKNLSKEAIHRLEGLPELIEETKEKLTKEVTHAEKEAAKDKKFSYYAKGVKALLERFSNL